ncbi:MAG TPA: N,N-dimethylformamidase beta subunit family domain-containing protein, partial [Thermoanaerobaculia bacterium]
FVVRAANPGSSAPLLIVSSTNTWQAYNTFGGRSAQQSELRGYVKVSFDRPYFGNDGLGRFVDWEDDFALWMKTQNIAYEVASDHDLDDPTILSRYKAVVLIAHSQYWTGEARRNLETFSRNGGHLAVLGGNTMWWQARREDNGRTLVAFKDYRKDAETVNFFDHPVYNPENLILGSSFRNGGYVNRAGDPSTWSDDPETFRMKPIAERTGFTVLDPTSWVFAGTGVAAGQMFGNAAAGLEVDGVVFSCGANGAPGSVDGSDGTPLNYHILAYVPASHGYGTIGFYTNSAGGAVFNAGTQEWVSALFSDPVVAQMTRNVLERFSLGGPMVYDPVTSNVRARELFNCPTVLGWEGAVGSAKLTGRCAVEGPAGIELSGPAETSLARNFAPTRNNLGAVRVRFALNADALQTPDFPIPVVTLRDRANGSTQRFAEVELYRMNGSNVVRATVYRNDGTPVLRGEWVPLPGGWQDVTLVWRSPGTTTIQVGDGAVRSIENTRGGQLANELVLYYPSTTVGGFVCMDRIEVGAP